MTNTKIWQRLRVMLAISGASFATFAKDSFIRNALGLPQGEGRPLEFQPFNIPESLVDLIGDYRKRFNNVSTLSFSALHWNHYVSIFTSKSADVYRNNFTERLIEIIYLRLITKRCINSRNTGKARRVCLASISRWSCALFRLRYRAIMCFC